MHYTDKGCEGLTLCYIGGGSQGWAWKLMSDLYLEPALSGTVRLYDIDRPAAERNEAIGNRMAAYEGAQGQWKYEVADSLEQGLQGADFVVVSILPATFEEMQCDVHMPEKYGIWQSVGDTTGPGGLFRALRTLPMYEVIARAIREVCPKAWVINYTNPMALCTAALYQVFPGIKAFGCCHEVFGAQRLMLLALGELAGIQEADRHTLRTNVLGVNHFTWINEASYKGLDLAFLYHKFAEKHAGGISEKQTDPHFMSKNLVKFDLLRKTGIIAAAGDRHLAEFVPAAYLGDERTPENWGFMLTPVSWRVQEKSALIH